MTERHIFAPLVMAGDRSDELMVCLIEASLSYGTALCEIDTTYDFLAMYEKPRRKARLKPETYLI